MHMLETSMLDDGRRAAAVTVHREIRTVTGKAMSNTLLNHWIKYCGKPKNIRTDPEGTFRHQGFRCGLAAQRIRLDIDPGDASWKTRLLGKDTGYHQTSSKTCSAENF